MHRAKISMRKKSEVRPASRSKRYISVHTLSKTPWRMERETKLIPQKRKRTKLIKTNGKRGMCSPNRGNVYEGGK